MRIPPFTDHYFLDMPRNPRCVLPDLPYHITQRGTNRQPVFHSAADRRTYLNLIRENLADAGVRSSPTA